jgi:hypothetical protein
MDRRERSLLDAIHRAITQLQVHWNIADDPSIGLYVRGTATLRAEKVQREIDRLRTQLRKHRHALTRKGNRESAMLAQGQSGAE